MIAIAAVLLVVHHARGAGVGTCTVYSTVQERQYEMRYVVTSTRGNATCALMVEAGASAGLTLDASQAAPDTASLPLICDLVKGKARFRVYAGSQTGSTTELCFTYRNAGFTDKS